MEHSVRRLVLVSLFVSAMGSHWPQARSWPPLWTDPATARSWRIAVGDCFVRMG